MRSSQYIHLEDNTFALLYIILKCNRPGGKGPAYLPPKGPQTWSAYGGGGTNYDDDDDDDDNDNDDYDDFDDDNDDDDMFSSSHRTSNTVGTRVGQ